MNFSDEEIRRQMRLAAFANADGGVMWHTAVMYKGGHANRWTR